jgi:hypothetical protein
MTELAPTNFSLRIEKSGISSDSRSTRTHYRLFVNDEVKVLFHQGHKLWIVNYSTKRLSKMRFRSLEELNAEFAKVFGV